MVYEVIVDPCYLFGCSVGSPWEVASPVKVNLEQSGAAVTCMTAIHGRLWCGCHCNVVVLDTSTLQIEVSKHLYFAFCLPIHVHVKRSLREGHDGLLQCSNCRNSALLVEKVSKVALESASSAVYETTTTEFVCHNWRTSD